MATRFLAEAHDGLSSEPSESVLPLLLVLRRVRAASDPVAALTILADPATAAAAGSLRDKGTALVAWACAEIYLRGPPPPEATASAELLCDEAALAALAGALAVSDQLPGSTVIPLHCGVALAYFRLKQIPQAQLAAQTALDSYFSRHLTCPTPTLGLLLTAVAMLCGEANQHGGEGAILPTTVENDTALARTSITRVLKRALAATRAVHGAKHVDLAIIYNKLGRFSARWGLQRDAVMFFRSALDALPTSSEADSDATTELDQGAAPPMHLQQLRASIHHGLGLALHAGLGTPAEVVAELGRALALKGHSGNAVSLARTLYALGAVASQRDKLTVAQDHLDLALATVDGVSELAAARVRAGLAVVACGRGNYELAVDLGRTALPVLQAAVADNVPLIAVVLVNLGVALQHLQQCDKARDMCLQARMLLTAAKSRCDALIPAIERGLAQVDRALSGPAAVPLTPAPQVMQKDAGLVIESISDV